MVAGKEISWKEASAPEFGHTSRQAFRAAVDQVAAKAKMTLPESVGRIDRAVQLVLQGDVELLPDGHARVASQCQGTTVYRVVNGTCECRDYPHAPASWCKHRLAAALVKRAAALMTTDQVEMPDAPPAQPSHGVPARHLVVIQGRTFVRYSGLLQMALERGLTSLTADWTFNSDDLSLAHAVAEFADGRCFEESGDATPANTTRTVALHFRRVALTRAKARTLRDALGIDLVAVEELAG